MLLAGEGKGGERRSEERLKESFFFRDLDTEKLPMLQDMISHMGINKWTWWVLERASKRMRETERDRQGHTKADIESVHVHACEHEVRRETGGVVWRRNWRVGNAG